jgi:hypothetical protein
MPSMLGSSRTIPWALCSCSFCRKQEYGFKAMHWYRKRSARNRENRLWRREQTP